MNSIILEALSERAEIVRGVTFSKRDAVNQRREGYLPVLRAGNIQSSLILDNDLVYVPCKMVSDRQRIRRGDIVMCTSSGSADIVGKTAFSFENWEGSFGAFCAVVRPKHDDCDPRYLYHYLQSPGFRHWTRNSSGVNIKNIRKSELDEVKVPFPDIDEQHRIAAILDKADTIRSKREQALALADELLKSTFLELFGDPVLNTKKLPTIQLGELIKVSSGDGLTAKNMDPNGEFPVYGGNGVNGYHSEFMFEESQIVIGRVGAYCGAVHVTKPRSWVTDNALYVREYKQAVETTYLEWALRFANLNQYAGRAAQPLISGSRIYPIQIVFPCLEDQKRFSDYVSMHRETGGKLEEHLGLANSLFASISQRAFRGEL